jgi:mycothiol synthase
MTAPLTQRALTDSDAAAYAALTATIAAAGDNDRREDEATFLFYLNHPDAAPEFEDFQGVFDGDRLVAMAWVLRRAEANPVHWMQSQGGVHPDYLGRGIGTRLVRWQADCARRIHEHHFPGHPMELDTRVPECNTDAPELLVHEGYARERLFFLMRRPAEAPLPEAPLPPGLELEPYADAVSAELRIAYEEAFLEHWHHVRKSAEDWAGLFEQHHARPDLSFLLRDPVNGEIAGFLISSFHETDAETEAAGRHDVHFSLIGTRAPYRGRGIASALIGHALRESRKAGLGGATLGVDAENPGALGVYERTGFAVLRRVAVYGRKFA